jgi:FMN phosphatase YigB (HAD superfamily)
MNPIRVLSIDFWNTLYELPGTSALRDEIRGDLLRRFAKFVKVHDPEVPRTLFRVADGFIKERWGRGLSSTDEDVLAHLLRHFDGLAEDQASMFLERIDDIHRTVLKPVPVLGAVQFLRWASARFPVYLISDTYTIRGRVIDGVLEDDGLLATLKSRLYSDVIGVEKPNTRAIEIILANERVPATHLLHIGDLETRDVEMSRRAGCQSVLINGCSSKVQDEKTAAVYRCSTFRELQRWMEARGC